MTCTALNTPVRDHFPIAKILAALRGRLRRPTQHRLRLSDHVTRDIGLSVADVERMNHAWPSQTQRHPML